MGQFVIVGGDKVDASAWRRTPRSGCARDRRLRKRLPFSIGFGGDVGRCTLLLDQHADDLFVLLRLKIGANGRNGDSFEIIFHVVVREYLPGGRVDEEFDLVDGVGKIFFRITRLEIGDDELFGNIDRFNRDIEQLA